MENHLPEDVMEDILSRLPVKLLVQFMSVSKSWRSLISSVNFGKLEFNRASQIGIHKIFLRHHDREYDHKYGFISLDCDTSSSRSLKPPFSIYEANVIIGSSNGLICTSTAFSKFVLWNPTTNEYKKIIPDLEYRRLNNKYTKSEAMYGYKYGFRLGFGFGYDVSTDDYKIVVVKRSIRIFSLKRGTWTGSADTQYLNRHITLRKRGVFFNGALHWSCIEHTNDGSPLRRVIVSFGLAEESFNYVAFPNDAKLHIFPTFMLCLVDVIDGYLCLTIPWANVWIMMKEYGVSSSWTEVNAMHFDPYKLRLSSTLCFQQRTGLLACFFRKNKLGRRVNCVERVHYVESLISPNVSNSERKRKYRLA